MPEPAGRITFLSLSSFILLDQACSIVKRAFDGDPPYHVGSSTQGSGWRDVDVRQILPDERYDEQFANPMFWSLFCLAVSEYLSRVSGLPVDYQVQRMSEANEKYGDEVRNPLGMGRLYAGGPG